MGFLTSTIGKIASGFLGGSSSGSSSSAVASAGGWQGMAYDLGKDAINFGLTERQNHMNRKHDWAMWNAQNEYNTPANQMKRFTEAGLNPNLIYGQTNMASPVHSSGQSLAQVESSMKTYYDLRQQDAMTQQIRANTYNTLQQARMIPLNKDYLEAQIRYMNAQADALAWANKLDVQNGTSRNSSFVDRAVRQGVSAVKEYGQEFGKIVGKIMDPVLNAKGDSAFDLLDDIFSGRTIFRKNPKTKSKRTVKLY